MPIDPAHQQEEFSVAYAQAVIAAAGFRWQAGTNVDDDSVDLTIAGRGPQGTLRSPKLDVQLKSWRGEVTSGVGDHWAFPLKRKNYDDLRHEDYQVPRVLLVVVVPHQLADWVHQDEEALLLRRCGYWKSLRGALASDNEQTVTVHMPRRNLFSVPGLEVMMEQIGLRGWP